MKPLLVFYIDIALMPPEDANRYVEEYTKNFYKLSDEYKVIILPVRNGNTRVECINPIFVPLEFYEKFKVNLKTQIVCKLNNFRKEKIKQNEKNNSSNHNSQT